VDRPSNFDKLAAAIARLDKQQEDDERALAAERAGLTGPARLAAEARARVEADRIIRERSTLEAIYAIQRVAEATAAAAEVRETAAAKREERMAAMTSGLLTITRRLFVVAAITLTASVGSLIAAWLR
jgi:hypothetical protein